MKGTNKTNVQLFNFKGSDVRVTDQNGDPWFVAKDVCGILGYSNPRKAVKDHCKRSIILKGHDSLPFTPSPRGITIIPEGDIYRLVARSKLPEAEQFETWLFDDVIPQIRKTGGYIPVEENETDTVLRGYEILMKTVEIQKKRLERQHKRITQDAPKVEYHDRVMDGNGLYGFREAAKQLGVQERSFMKKILRR